MECDHPFFIVGVPRSGTTLLQRILDMHPQLAVCPETHLFSTLDRILATQKITTQWQYQALLDMLLHSLSNYNDPAHQITTDFQRDYPNYRGATQGLLQQLAIRYLKTKGRKRFGEKTPTHLLHLSVIHELYPMAKIIIIERHPLDVSASLLRSYDWSPLTRNLSTIHKLTKIGILIRRSQRAAKTMQAQYPGKCYVVRYEELVSQPKPVLSKVCQFLGLNFHNDLLRFHEQPFIAPANPIMQDRHQNLSHPISTAQRYQYANTLDEPQQQWIDSFLRRERQYATYPWPKKGTKWPLSYYWWFLLGECYLLLRVHDWRSGWQKIISYWRLKTSK